jgi:hypothetical protein
LSNASKQGGLLKQSKVVADYMMNEHEQIPQGVTPNPKTMQGYKYIFHGEEEVASLLPTAPEYRVGFKKKTRRRFSMFIFPRSEFGNISTIDSVWRWIESQSILDKKVAKDVALSFSLFKLLKRRLCGYGIGEAGLTKTLDFVLHGVISEDGNYARAFRVIEMELAFLYDFLYTRFDTVSYRYKGSQFYFAITVTVWNCVTGAFSRHYHRSNLKQRVYGIDVIHMVTILLLIIVLALSLLPTSLNSMWDTVHEMQDPSLLLAKEWTQKFPMVKRAQLSSVTREAEKCWQRAFGQYSLLLDFDYHPWNVLSVVPWTCRRNKRRTEGWGKDRIDR